MHRFGVCLYIFLFFVTFFQPEAILAEDLKAPDSEMQETEAGESAGNIADNKKIISETFEYINPAYSENETRLSSEQSFRKESYQLQETVSDIVYENLNDAVLHIRECMKERAESIPVSVYISCSETGVTEWQDFAKLLVNLAQNHTGVPDEGDYLHYQFGRYKANMSHDQNKEYFSGTVTYQFVYYTTREQELEMDQKIAETVSALNLPGMKEIEKIRSIYRYICSTVSYDYEHLYEDDYKLKYTAYGALINGTAVCQGYANLMYRMALEAGIDVRVVEGTGHGIPHAWNIVKLRDSFYFCDTTWDSPGAGSYNDNYFLKSRSDFIGHDSMGIWNDPRGLTETFILTETSYIPVSGISFSDDLPDTVINGESFQTVISVFPDDATIKEFSIYIDPQNIAFADKDGTITVSEPGILILTVSSEDGNYTDQKEVRILPVKTGWQFEKEGYRYYLTCTEYAAGQWVMDSGKWYYFDTDGFMHTGWLKYKGKWYFLKSSGEMATGWVRISDRWYYLNENGAMHTGWLKYSEKWYYLKSSGEMVTGIIIIDGKTFRFDSSGVLE